MQRMSSQTNPNGLRNADSNAGGAPRRGMILPFQPLAMSFDSVNYFVDMPAVRITSIIFSGKLYNFHCRHSNFDKIFDRK